MPNPTLERLMAAKRPTATLRVCLDPDAAEETPDDETLYVDIRLQALTREQYRLCMDSCPPKEEDVAKAEAAKDTIPVFDEATFVPTLVAACSLDPQMTTEEAKTLLDEWSGGDVAELYIACLGLCQRSRVDALPKGSAPITV